MGLTEKDEEAGFILKLAEEMENCGMDKAFVQYEGKQAILWVRAGWDVRQHCLIFPLQIPVFRLVYEQDDT